MYHSIENNRNNGTRVPGYSTTNPSYSTSSDDHDNSEIPPPNSENDFNELENMINGLVDDGIIDDMGVPIYSKSWDYMGNVDY